MSIINNIEKIIIKFKSDPRHAVTVFFQRKFSNLSDKTYLKVLYRLIFGRSLNLENPKTFNEKLNWLKLYCRRPEFSLMADKFEVKQHVKNLIGEQYVVKNYGVYERWDDIDFDSLPDSFVIKGTHDSGGAFICKNKATFDKKLVREKVEANQRRSFFYWYREWPYKNIRPRIIVDELLDDHTGNELRDYKFWCFNGKPTYMYCTIKGKEVYENFYDMDFQPVMIDHGFPRHQPEFDKPKNFELMKKLALKLSEGVPFVRVDFFDVEGKVYFGEYTFYDWGGMRPFNGLWDLELGKKMTLPGKQINNES